MPRNVSVIITRGMAVRLQPLIPSVVWHVLEMQTRNVVMGIDLVYVTNCHIQNITNTRLSGLFQWNCLGLCAACSSDDKPRWKLDLSRLSHVSSRYYGLSKTASNTCYRDDADARTFPYRITNMVNNNTANNCLGLCSQFGYGAGGMEFSSECCMFFKP